MILKIGTLKQLAAQAGHILQPVYEHIAFNIHTLDDNYGADRDIDEDDGGYKFAYFLEFTLPVNPRKRLLVTNPQTPKIATCSDGCASFGH